MSINLDHIPSLNYEKGEQVLASDIETIAIKTFNKINFLNPENVGYVNTGLWYDSSNSLYYMNYCGKFRASKCNHKDTIDQHLSDLEDELETILDKYGE